MDAYAFALTLGTAGLAATAAAETAAIEIRTAAAATAESIQKVVVPTRRDGAKASAPSAKSLVRPGRAAGE